MREWLSGDKSARKESPKVGESLRKDKLNMDERGGFLDKGFRLEGTLEVTGTVRIEGEVKGEVRSKGQLILGETAHIEGEIECAFLSVAGRVNGNVRCTDRLEILRSGVVEGDVHTPSLGIEPGGILEGHCHMRTEDKPASVARALTPPVTVVTPGSSESDSREVV